jgi:hypothetical protein
MIMHDKPLKKLDAKYELNEMPKDSSLNDS